MVDRWILGYTMPAMQSKPTRGRPRKTHTRSARIDVRTTPARKASIRQAAAVDGSADMSEWILTQCARREDELQALIEAVNTSKKGKRK